MTSEEEFEERHRFLKGKGGKQLLHSMQKSTTVFQWASASEHHYGSMFFVRTSSGVFGVTAKHVYVGYLEHAARAQVSCQVGNLPFNPHQRVNSIGKERDIATFRISEKELEEIGAITVPWPPVMPRVGHVVLWAGYPATEKKITGPRFVDFSAYTALVAVSSVSETDISIVVPPDDQLVDVFGKGLPPRQYFMGGMSGGPLATVADNFGILTWHVCGIIHASFQDYELLQAVRADFIDEQGMVTA